ncbi:MAG: 50S ribosomal protein L21 [Patescibacteria group bacterium]
MFAIIKTGGKQYLVKKGDVLFVEKLAGKVGEKIDFDQILLIGEEKDGELKIGQPLVKGAKVKAEILEQSKGPKIKVIKFKRKVRYHRKKGHRQPLTKVKILEIK